MLEPWERGLGYVIRDIPIVNRCLGLTLPLPAQEHLKSPSNGDALRRNTDAYFAALAQAVCGASAVGSANWQSIVPRFVEFLPDPHILSALTERVIEMGSLSDKALLEKVTQSFTFNELDLNRLPERGGTISVKINHGYWEYLTCTAFSDAGIPYFRDLKPRPLFDTCRFNGLLATALSRMSAGLQGAENGNFASPGRSLGVSFNSGEGAVFDDLVLPLTPTTKGAMIGALGFFNTLLPSRAYRFVDGSSAKNLFWRDELGSFFEKIRAVSDAIVFVVPSHLRKIKVSDWNGETVTVVIPDVHVHELWPAVLPYAAGRIADVLARHSRMTVIVQAAIMSVPLGVMIDRMRQARPNATVSYFDLGQVLDVAAGPGGPWSRREDVREHLAGLSGNPLALGPP